MSKDRSGLPGIWIAAWHLVCVSVGAPGPVQAPNAAPVAASDTAPSSAEADESLADMLVSPLVDECNALLRCRVFSWNGQHATPPACRSPDRDDAVLPGRRIATKKAL